MHEVERPDLVEPVSCHEGSTRARRNATSGPLRQVQAEGVIHAVDPSVIPPVAVKAQLVIALQAATGDWPRPPAGRPRSLPPGATLCGYDECEGDPFSATSGDSLPLHGPAQFTPAGPPLVQIAYLLLVELYEFEGKLEDFVIVSDPPFLIIGELVAGGLDLYHAIFCTVVD